MRVLQVLQTLLLLLLLLPTFSSRWITAAAAAFALWFFTIPDWHLPTCKWREKKIERESHKRWRGLHSKIANSESGEWRTAAVNQVPISAPPLTLAAVTRHICTCIHKYIFFVYSVQFCSFEFFTYHHHGKSEEEGEKREKIGKQELHRMPKDEKWWFSFTLQNLLFFTIYLHLLFFIFFVTAFFSIYNTSFFLWMM